MQHLILVGAGPHGLAVLSALAERQSWPEHVTVVDATAPSWCAAWDQKLERLNLDRLRSPQVHHPGVRPMAFRDAVEALPPDERLALRRPEAELAPTPRGMRRFIDALGSALGPITWIHGTATALHVDASGAAAVTIEHARPPSTDAATHGRGPDPIRLTADAVVLAHNPSVPRVPDWAEAMVAAGRATHASSVDIRTAAIAGREVFVVGGGLTAAGLALEAVRRGARCTLLARRPLRARPYDVDASWIGPRRLDEYRMASMAERRALIDVARDGGTIPPRTLAELRASDGPLTLVEGATDIPARIEAALAASAPPLIWLATGFAQDIRHDPLVAPLIDELGVTTHRGLPEVSDALGLGAAPVYVAGPYAALMVGPACRNLAGARPAAQRIAGALAAEV